MSLTAHFTALGMDEDDAASRARQMERVHGAFAHLAGAPATWSWFVPGRLEVFGKHTDYGGGRSLVAAVPRGFAVAAGPRADGHVRVADLRSDVSADIDPLDDTRTLTGWASYVQVVARRLARNFPGAPLGVNLVFASDLPRAAGVSSSSALVVGVASALAARGRLAERDEWRAELRSVEEVAAYFGCIENGLDFGGLRGTAGVGTHGGSEDHTAIMACRAGHVSQFRFMPAESLGATAVPPHWTFVVAPSGVHADKAGSVKDRFNRAALSARALLACWNRGEASPARSLAAALSGAGALDELKARVKTGHARRLRRRRPAASSGRTSWPKTAACPRPPGPAGRATSRPSAASRRRRKRTPNASSATRCPRPRRWSRWPAPVAPTARPASAPALVAAPGRWCPRPTFRPSPPSGSRPTRAGYQGGPASNGSPLVRPPRSWP